jgi:ubiquinone/menaquinone biosynthesis C-methylase UbiE
MDKEKTLLDQVKQFWNTRPCNIRHSNKPIGTMAYFSEIEKKKYQVEPHILRFAEFERWKGKSVLEIGCGIGTDTMNFARNGARVTAVDLSDVSLSLAIKRAELLGYGSQITFFQANGESLSDTVPIQNYDLVYSFGVIHHTPNPSRVMAEVKKYMGPESELRIMLYSKFSYKLFWLMHETGDWKLEHAEKILTEYSEAQTGCPVTHTYAFDEIRELLAGFEILQMEKDHIFTWNIESYKRHEYKKDPAWANVSERYLQQMAKELGWHTLVQARLRKDQLLIE